MNKLLVLLLSAGLLTACGGAEEEPKGVIPQHQLDAMKKAENVEDVLQQADQQRREDIDGN